MMKGRGKTWVSFGLTLVMLLFLTTILWNVETATAEGWSTETVDSGKERIGGRNALAYDPDNGYPAIGYSDETKPIRVKFARWNGSSWDIETVDRGGHAIDLAYDPTDGYPSLSYGRWNLKFAHWNGSSWDIEVVEASSVAPRVASLVYDPSGNPSISYCKTDNKGYPAELRLARRNGSSWEIEIVEAGVAAEWSSLAYDLDGNPSIAYSDDMDEEVLGIETLKFARWNGSSWDVDTVETGVYGYGFFASLAYDPNPPHYPSIAHAWEGVRFLRWNGNDWVLEIFDDGQWTFGASLVYDSDGRASISYIDETSPDLDSLKFACRNGPNNWEIEIVGSEFRLGWGASLKFDPDQNPSISYHDWGNENLKFARKGSSPPPPPGVMHVHSIDMSLKQKGPWTNAIAEVKIVDEDGDPVPQATVEGHWSGLTSDSDVFETGSDGFGECSSDKVKKPSGCFVFTVDAVYKEGWTYNPDANEEDWDQICDGGGGQSAGIGPAQTWLFTLFQNSPNPFSTETMISFSLPEMTHTTLTIHDVTGRTVATLMNGELTAGTHTVEWNADVPSGVYFYRIQVDDFTAGRKMLLLR